MTEFVNYIYILTLFLDEDDYGGSQLWLLCLVIYLCLVVILLFIKVSVALKICSLLIALETANNL